MPLVWTSSPLQPFKRHLVPALQKCNTEDEFSISLSVTRAVGIGMDDSIGPVTYLAIGAAMMWFIDWTVRIWMRLQWL